MKKSNWIGVALLVFVLLCRFIPAVADFYAEELYAPISSILSFLAAPLPFCLEEIVVIGFAAIFIWIAVKAIKDKRKFLWWLKKTLLTAMWVYVWFYMGWGNNYFRTPLYWRIGAERTHFEKEEFLSFLEDYTGRINAVAGKTTSLERDELQKDIKRFYSEEVTRFGYSPLRGWQKAKRPLLHPLYSWVGVLGYMGPFFGESTLNPHLSPKEYPSVLAHEFGHLAGVSGEGEANYWAYEYCSSSDDEGTRYSGLLAVLPYVVSNARSLLSEEEYGEWIGKISPDAIEDSIAIGEFWDGKKIPVLDRLQHSLMEINLRSNRISSGAKDYYGVVSMIMTMEGWKKERGL